MIPYGFDKNKKQFTRKFGTRERCVCPICQVVHSDVKKAMSKRMKRRARRLGKIFSYE